MQQSQPPDSQADKGDLQKLQIIIYFCIKKYSHRCSGHKRGKLRESGQEPVDCQGSCEGRVQSNVSEFLCLINPSDVLAIIYGPTFTTCYTET